MPLTALQSGQPLPVQNVYSQMHYRECWENSVSHWYIHPNDLPELDLCWNTQRAILGLTILSWGFPPGYFLKPQTGFESRLLSLEHLFWSKPYWTCIWLNLHWIAQRLHFAKCWKIHFMKSDTPIEAFCWSALIPQAADPAGTLGLRLLLGLLNVIHRFPLKKKSQSNLQPRFEYSFDEESFPSIKIAFFLLS